MKPGDLLRTRCDAPPSVVEWADDDRVAGLWTQRIETLPPGVPVLFLRPAAWAHSVVLVGGRVGWVLNEDLEPL